MATPRRPSSAILRDDLGRPAAALVELRGLGGDLARGEVARGVADQPLLFGQLEVHRAAQSSARRPARRSATRARRGQRPRAARARRRGLGRTATGDAGADEEGHVEGVVAERGVEWARRADALAQPRDLARAVRDGRARRPASMTLALVARAGRRRRASSSKPDARARLARRRRRATRSPGTASMPAARARSRTTCTSAWRRAVRPQRSTTLAREGAAPRRASTRRSTRSSARTRAPRDKRRRGRPRKSCARCPAPLPASERA